MSIMHSYLVVVQRCYMLGLLNRPPSVNTLVLGHGPRSPFNTFALAIVRYFHDIHLTMMFARNAFIELWADIA